MEIKLVKGLTIYEAGKNTIKQIDAKDMTHQNFVVVPDTFSMQAENLIFDVLKIKSAFNIDVVGISKLASKILRDNNVAFSRVSSIEEVFHIFHAVKECEKDFQYFGKCDIEFCQHILQVIKQFKACKVRPNDIKDTKNQLLNAKLHDLRMIYECYEKSLGDKLDLSKLLDFALENAQKFDEMKNINLFFVNFDSFTLEINSFICSLAKCVNKVYIGVATPEIGQGNAFIYDHDIEEKTQKLANESGVLPFVESPKIDMQKNQLKIVKNLFAFDVEQGKDESFFVNLLAKSKQDEVEFVAKYIRNEIYYGARFKDFAIAIPDSKYYDKIKAEFAKFDIVCYTDDATNLLQTILGRFVLKLFEIARLGVNLTSLQYLVSNKLLGDDKQCLHDLEYQQINKEDEFLALYPKYAPILSQINLLKNARRTNDFTAVLRDVLAIVEENYENVIGTLDDDRKYKEESENKQAKEMFVQVLDKLDQIGAEQEFSLDDFEKLLTLSLQSVKVETVPSYIDAVFVGDATESYFEDVKTLFVLGANGKALPKTKADTGIIDDDDIEKLRQQFVLGPEIKVLNRRSRLKLFECLQHAKEKLIVSCPATREDKQIAQFVYDLRTMFGNNELKTSDIALVGNDKLTEEERFENLLLYLGGRNTLLEAYTTLKRNETLPTKYAGALHALAEELPVERKYQNIDTKLAQSLLKKRVSASRLETYFSCPFRHFVEHMLDVKEKETIVPDKRNYGQFIHKLLELFFEQYDVKQAKIDSVDKFLKENVEKIAKNYYSEKTLRQKHFLKYLQNEGKIVLQSAINEARQSDFKAEKFEFKIECKFDENKDMIGFVDRIDKFGKFYRIIDYKTGVQAKIKDSLFCGKKLQLFLYGKNVPKEMGVCSGVYYFNCQTKYTKRDSSSKLLHGLTLKDENVIFATDRRIEEYGFKSDIVPYALRSNPDKAGFKFKNGENYLVEDFDTLFDYADKLAHEGYKEIKDGYIEPKPLEDVCEYCPYISICKHRAKDGSRKILDSKGKL